MIQSKKIFYFAFFIPFFLFTINSYSQNGPAGVGNLDGSDGQPELIFWLSADSTNFTDGDQVDLLPDISGNNNDFSQSTGTEQPTFVANGIGGLPSIDFDGSDQSLVDDDGENYINGLNTFSLFAIVQSDQTGTDAGFFDGEDPNGNDNVFTIRYDNTGADGGANNVIKAGITTSDNGEVNMESSAELQTTSPQLLTLQWASSDEITLIENGELDDPPSSPSDIATGSIVNANKLVLGKGTYDNGSSWDGKIAETFLYSNKLNSARRTIIENYLSEKYGITITNDKLAGNASGYNHNIAGIGKETDGEQAITNSAGVYVNQNGNFDAGDYLMLAHDNATNDVASKRNGAEITNSGAEAAWNRDWYLEKTGNLDIRISFNIPEALEGGQYPETASNYVLLYRSGTTGDYSQVTTGDGIEGSEEVYFNVSDASLNNGYYTLGTLDQSASPVEGKSGKTWYTLVSGDWSDPAIWTLDPSGALPDNPNNETPLASSTDNVVILTGRTVTVNSDSLENANLTIEGRLDLQNTKGHSFSTINGTGRILLSSDNFPSGDASHFVTEGEGEGTVEFYGDSGYPLANSDTYYDVRIDLTNSSDTLTMKTDYTVNGNLILNQGVLQINNNTNTTRLTLDVANGVTVRSNASITVGEGDVFNEQSGYGNYHKSFHQFRVGGNFTNNGTVRLTNLNVPDYANPDPTGVSLVFYGAADKEFTCNNTTDIYNLVVDKGTDRTYELELYADDKSHFALFGQNNDEWDDTDPAHPENRKALWIANGTLRLTGSVYIPSLTEGTRDFTIGERAGLILDGPNVYVQNTALSGDDFTGLSHGQPNGINDGGSQQALYPFGKLQVDAGEYYLANGEAINFRDEAPGIIEVNGGRLEANQIAISSSASAGTFVFTVTGGEVYVTDEYGSDGSRALLNLDNSNMVFNMSGGSIYVTGTNGHTPNAVHIGSSEQNHNVTGGKVYIQSGATSQVQSTAPFYNVEVVNGSTLSLLEPLKALGSLTIENNAALTANDYDVYIGNNLDFKDGASYSHGSNTTTFTGDQSSNIWVRNTTNAGDLTFNNMRISKEQRYDPSLYHEVEVLSGAARSTNDHPIDIQGNLTVERGEFNVNEWEVDLKGDLQITDGNILYGASTGFIVMNNASNVQNIIGTTGGNQHFGNIEFANGNGITLQNNVDVNDVKLNQGSVNLDVYNLDISGDLTTSGTYGSSLMFTTAGNASDGGLTLPIDLAEGSAGTEFIFPIGTGSSYNPALVTQSETIADSGKITISPVNTHHPSASKPSKTIEYYWVVDTTGFKTVTYDQLKYTFTYSGTFPGGVKRGTNLWPEDYTWYDNGNIENEPYLEFPYSAYLRSDFTLGNAGDFKKPEIFYSRVPTSDYNIGSMPQWSDGNTWSTDSHTGTAAGDYPQDGDIAIIGYGGADPGDGGGNRHHVAYRSTDNYDLAKVVIDASEEDGVWSSRLFIEEGSTIDMGLLEGDGTLQLYLDNTNPSTILGDFGDFTTNEAEGSRVLFFGSNGDPIEIPDVFNQLPNVRIEGNGTRTFYFPRELTVRGELRVDHNATLRLEHDLTVNGDFRLGNHQEGMLEFPDDESHTLTVNSDLRLTSDGASEVTIDNSTENTLEHRLQVAGNIELDQGNRFDLFTDNSGGNNVILDLFGENDAEMSNLDDMPVELYRLEMNKQTGTDIRIYRDPGDPSVSFSNFSINGATDGLPKAIELNSGRLMLQDGGIDVTLTSGGADFKIPSGATLHAKHGATVRTSGSNTGILLDGSIEASYNSNWQLDDGINNYIEYTASGNAAIDIYQADFYVGSQIRRNTVTDGGILSFTQHHPNSNIVLGTNADQGGAASRGVFELVNAGSYFEQAENATITIANHVNNASAPAFNINLDASEINLGNGSSVVFGSNQTAPDQNLGIQSNQPLKNLKVNNASNNNPVVTMKTVNLEADTLTIEPGATFDANGLDLTLYGDLYSNGIFTSNKNSTIFSGTANQQITGNPEFYNLTKNTSNTLTLNANITVNNELRLEAGTLADGGNTLNTKGDVWMEAIHNYGGSGDGILFNGNTSQNLQGNGTFGRLSVNNSSGIYVPEGNTITINDDLQMEKGVLDIGKNLLVLDEDATITEKNAFSELNMVQTNISFTDAGIKKYFPEITSNTIFTYPLGSSGKYTPVEVSIDQKNSGGSIRIKAADEMHPGIIEDEEDPDPEITDADNVLQYHWVVEAQSVSGFSGDMYMEYDDEDTSFTNPYDITDYITARLLSNSTQWNKYDNASFDQNNKRLNFGFSNVGQDGISGDYTAGVDGFNFNGAIPDSVPIYHSKQNGNWFDNATWQEDIPGGPKGAIAIVQDSVYMGSNYLVGYKTIIKKEGIVDLGTTFGHRLGTVEGTGKLRLERGAMPAGVYEVFFSRNGGTIEFAGNDSYDVLSEVTNVNNLKFSGTGERRLPNLDLEVYGLFNISGEDATLEVINEHDKILTLDSNVVFTQGSFDAGTGNSKVIMNGSSEQTITGDFTGDSAFYNLEINNSQGITISGGTEVDNVLEFTSGIITTTPTDMLTIDNSSETAVTGHGNSNYVDGPMQKLIDVGSSFDFPVGDAGRYGEFDLISTNTSKAEYWEAEYYNANPDNNVSPDLDTSKYESSLERVSGNEYWRVNGVSGSNSRNRIRWDSYSMLPAMSSDADRENNLKMVEWIDANTQWEIVPSNVDDNGVDSGTITSDNDLSLAGDHYFTLGTTEAAPLATAGFETQDTSLCEGESIDLIIGNSGDPDITITINKDGNPYDTITVSSAGDTTITISSNAALSDDATYSIDSVGDSNGQGTVYGEPIIVDVNSLPSPVIDGDTSVCQNSTQIYNVVSPNSEHYYDWTVLGGDIVSGSGTDQIQVEWTDYGSAQTVEVTEGVLNVSGCETTTDTLVDVYEMPEANVTATPVEACYPDTINLEAGDTPSDPAKFDYTWSPDSVTNVSERNPYFAPTSNIDTVSETINFKVIIENASNNSCSATDSIDVTIHRKPETGDQYYVPSDFDQ